MAILKIWLLQFLSQTTPYILQFLDQSCSFKVSKRLSVIEKQSKILTDYFCTSQYIVDQASVLRNLGVILHNINN